MYDPLSNNVSASAEAVEGRCDAHRLVVRRFPILGYDRPLVALRKGKDQRGQPIRDSV
jgi:hypothetical protein